MAGNMNHTIVIGAGQAGLAAAAQLRNRGVECEILEAADLPGNSWRSRWDSLRLFTPAQHCSLPGATFPAAPGARPGKDQVADYLAAYAADMPVTTGVAVEGVRRGSGGFTLDTSAGTFEAPSVVVATGATSVPYVPGIAERLDPAIHQLHSSNYRNAAALPPGGVLVVGAGTSGIEIAVELSRSRQVWLAGRVPFHVPDALLDHAGGLYWQFIHRVLTRSTPMGRKVAAGFTAHGGPLISVSMDDARKAGVRALPRLEEVDGNGRPMFGGHALQGVDTALWATGFKAQYGWIEGLPLDSRGWPVTTRGVVESMPGLYFVGLPFQYGLTSSLLGGVGRDAAHVAGHIAAAGVARDSALGLNH